MSNAPDEFSSESAPTANGSSRPIPYHNRATTETDVRRLSLTISNHGDEPRASLGRGQSTSVAEGDGRPSIAASPRDAANRSYYGTQSTTTNNGQDAIARLAESWSSGFGEITNVGALPPFGRTWTSQAGAPAPAMAFDGPRRGSTGGNFLTNAVPGPLDGIPRSASMGAPLAPASAGGVSSAMHDAARLKDWDRVKDICNRDPSSGAFVGPGGYTALHHICDKRCPKADVAEAVIRAFPDALAVESLKGWTPLHLACRFKCNKDVIGALLNVHPELGKQTVSKPDRQRRTPLFYAVRYLSPPGVVPQLLEVDPSVVLADNENLASPLAVFWDDFAEKMEGRRALHPYIEQIVPPDPAFLRERLASQTDSSELFENWKRANMFLKAAFGFPLNDDEELADTKDRKWRILHATAAAKVHNTLFRMACALHPEQALEIDENDLYGHLNEAGENEKRKQTALHLAAASNASGSSGHSVITTLLRLNPEAANVADEIDGSYPLHRIVENKHKQHWTVDGINPLYMISPAVAEKADRHGKLPIHRAAAAITHEEDEEDLATRSIICNLLQVFPNGASARDEDNCMPLHLVAMNAEEWNEEVQAVFSAHEVAISTRTGRRLHNSLPIHLAAANPKAQRSLIERLVEHNPRGVSQADGHGKMALHLACELGKEWVDDGIEVIYNAFTQAVRLREDNERHWMALHMASASSAACGNLIKKLVELNPEACEIADSQDRLPLHLACQTLKNWEGGLSAIFDGNPNAIGVPDSKGRIPLYIVAERYAQARENANDEAELHQDPAGCADELDVLFNLIRSDPTTIPETC